jgi:hypothetical protein
MEAINMEHLQNESAGPIITVNSFKQLNRSDQQGPKLSVTTNLELNEPSLDCLICAQPKKQSLMQPDFMKDCNDHMFCMECTRMYLSNAIKTSQVESIRCPYEGCQVEYSEEYIRTIVNEAQFNNYKRFKHIQLVSK